MNLLFRSLDEQKIYLSYNYGVLQECEPRKRLRLGPDVGKKKKRTGLNKIKPLFMSRQEQTIHVVVKYDSASRA